MFVLGGCSTKKYNLENLPKEYLEFGFEKKANGYKESHVFFKNGQVFKKNTIMSAPMLSITKEEASVLFKEAERVRLSGFTFNVDDFTMQYFVVYKSANAPEMVWLWPRTEDDRIPKELEMLMQMLNAQAKKVQKEMIE